MHCGAEKVKAPRFEWRVALFETAASVERVNGTDEVPVDNKRMKQINPTREDCIRMAAFIDCEGCIEIRLVNAHGKCRSSFRLQISVANTDPRMTNWCSRVFGGSSVVTKIGQKYAGAKPLYVWRVYGQHAETVIRHCHEFFLIKQEQVAVALEYRATIRGPIGRSPLAPGVQEKRAELAGKIRLIKKQPFLGTVSPIEGDGLASVEAENNKTRNVG